MPDMEDAGSALRIEARNGAPQVYAPPKKKCCGCGRPLCCTICAAITAAVLALVLFVVIPQVADLAMNHSGFCIEDAKIEDLELFPLGAHVNANISFGVTLPVGVKLHKTNITLVSPGTTYKKKYTEGPMATFDLYETNLHAGDNTFNMDGEFTIMDIGAFISWVLQMLSIPVGPLNVTAPIKATTLAVYTLHLHLDRQLDCSLTSLGSFEEFQTEQGQEALARRLREWAEAGAKLPIPSGLNLACNPT